MRLPVQATLTIVNTYTGYSSVCEGSHRLQQLMQLPVHMTVTDVIAYTGNSNEDACGWSPAGVPGVVAVGAVDSQMRRWYSSNW